MNTEHSKRVKSGKPELTFDTSSTAGGLFCSAPSEKKLHHNCHRNPQHCHLCQQYSFYHFGYSSLLCQNHEQTFSAKHLRKWIHREFHSHRHPQTSSTFAEMKRSLESRFLFSAAQDRTFSTPIFVCTCSAYLDKYSTFLTHHVNLRIFFAFNNKKFI